MPKCSNCGTELEVGQKFCFECGAPAPQVKKCPSCQSEIPLKMKFCPECGYNFNGSASANGTTLGMGDKNVIAGDVNQNITNTTINNIVDDTKKVNNCQICGKHLTNDNGFTCPKCGNYVCADCYSLEHKCCKNCAPKKLAGEGSFTDERDGQIYRTVKIGNQVWFAENLRYKCDGSFVYDEDPSNLKKYGRLYTWNAAVSAAPKGWHVATKDDFDALESYILANSKNEPKVALKSNTDDWTEAEKGVDEYGFCGLPSGYYSCATDSDSVATYESKGELASFWTGTEDSEGSAYSRHLGLYYYSDNFCEDISYKDDALAVRLVQGADETFRSAPLSDYEKVMLEQAKTAFLAGDIDAAFSKISAAYESNSDNLKIYKWSIRIVRVLDFDGAYETATDETLAENVCDALVIQVENAVRNGDIGTAERLLNKCKEKWPCNPLVLWAEVMWAYAFFEKTGLREKLDDALKKIETKEFLFSDEYENGSLEYAKWYVAMKQNNPPPKIESDCWHKIAYPHICDVTVEESSK